MENLIHKKAKDLTLTDVIVVDNYIKPVNSPIDSELRKIRVYYWNIKSLNTKEDGVKVICKIKEISYINNETDTDVPLAKYATELNGDVHLWFDNDIDVIVKMKINDILGKL